MRPIGGDVRRELSRFGPAAGMADLVAAWPEAVGEAIARNAWPARLSRDGTLHVATESAAWAFELGQLEGRLLERLRATAGEAAPARLRFAVGRLPEPDPAAERAVQPGPKPSPDDEAEARRVAAEIEDEDIRSAVADAVARGLAHRRSGRGL
jgi:hypothetical protein